MEYSDASLLMQGEYIPSTVLTLGLLHRDTETSDGDEAYEYLDQETTSSSGPTSRRAVTLQVGTHHLAICMASSEICEARHGLDVPCSW